MNILQTNCATYDHGLYTQLACLWAWLILIIMYGPIYHHYYIHMYMLDVIYIDGGMLNSLLLHPLPFTKIHCQPNPQHFLWLTSIMFSNILGFVCFLHLGDGTWQVEIS